jgi:hypothetical protein
MVEKDRDHASDAINPYEIPRLEVQRRSSIDGEDTDWNYGSQKTLNGMLPGVLYVVAGSLPALILVGVAFSTIGLPPEHILKRFCIYGGQALVLLAAWLASTIIGRKFFGGELHVAFVVLAVIYIFSGIVSWIWVAVLMLVDAVWWP